MAKRINRFKSRKPLSRKSRKRTRSKSRPVVRYRTKIQRVRVRRNPRGMLSQPAVKFGLAAVIAAVFAGALDQSVLANRTGPLKPSQWGAIVTGLLSRSKIVKGAANKAIATGAAVGMLYPTAQQYIGAPVASAVGAIAGPIAGMLPASTSVDPLVVVAAPSNTLASIGAAKR